jgi:hypothetical protein
MFIEIDNIKSHLKQINKDFSEYKYIVNNTEDSKIDELDKTIKDQIQTIDILQTSKRELNDK